MITRNSTPKLLLKSLTCKNEHINSIREILSFVEEKNSSTKVKIVSTTLSKCGNWFLSKDGIIRNKDNTFFLIQGLEYQKENNLIQQPIIIQNEIGFLGIIAKEIEGNLYFLMQAKIEPGNLNNIQISPTIQATKSNFLQSHGGKKPKYLEYFINAKDHEIIVDQLQSEQSSRFLKKRNRNVIIKIDEQIEVFDSHIWISIYQLKQLLKINNLVNMDTRTVISCIPFHKISKEILEEFSFSDNFITNSIFGSKNIDEINLVWNKLNDIKMFNNSKTQLLPLCDLKDWRIDNSEIYSTNKSPFSIIFCNIEIEGREVTKWSQPLLRAFGKAIFGLITAKIDGKLKVLVKFKEEVGNFDVVELGPSIQIEATDEIYLNSIESYFMDKIYNKECIKYDVFLSEEGGRFYHEENRNIIIEINHNELSVLSENYFWLDLNTIMHFMEINNTVNIQLRNLLSLMEVN